MRVCVCVCLPIISVDDSPRSLTWASVHPVRPSFYSHPPLPLLSQGEREREGEGWRSHTPVHRRHILRCKPVRPPHSAGCRVENGLCGMQPLKNKTLKIGNVDRGAAVVAGMHICVCRRQPLSLSLAAVYPLGSRAISPDFSLVLFLCFGVAICTRG